MVIKPVVLTTEQLIELIDIEFKAAHLANMLSDIGLTNDMISMVKNSALLRIVLVALDMPLSIIVKTEEHLTSTVLCYGYHPEMTAKKYLDWLLLQRT
jgi:hypothetical protein